MKRESSFISKATGTPGLKSTSKDQEDQKPEILAARNPLVTPVQRTPSSRKSIVGRQIMARSASNSSQFFKLSLFYFMQFTATYFWKNHKVHNHHYVALKKRDIYIYSANHIVTVFEVLQKKKVQRL